jgi:hypothetical protein
VWWRRRKVLCTVLISVVRYTVTGLNGLTSLCGTIIYDFLTCIECTAFSSILRRSSSIIASPFVLITLILSWLFSLLTLFWLLNFKEFVYYIYHNDGVEFVYIFHTGLEMCQLFVRSLMAKNIFMFVPCINSIRALFIIPQRCTQLQNHRNIKTIKIPIVAPTCFGTRRNHHQGVILCLAKTTVMVVYPRRLWRGQCHGSIPTCCAGVRYTAHPHICASLWSNKKSSLAKNII